MDFFSRKKLNNGMEIPVMGFGTWNLSRGSQAENAVKIALETGYRLIDTAAIYGNEESAGKAIRESTISREKIFVTTKLWNSDHANPQKAFDKSLGRLGLEYVDLYLMHWPVKKRLASWKAMEKILDGGKCKAIGVSNFTIRHLEELLAHASVVPVVNQVEFSPFLFQKELLDYCTKNKIQLEAYSPLTHGHKINDQKISAIAKKYNRSNAQIMLCWSLQHGVVPIPKATKKERIEENSNVFDFSISDVDMKALDGFSQNLRYCWDPTGFP